MFFYSASVSDGGAKYSFHHKGLILARSKEKTTTLETSLDHAIEAGAEEVTWDEEEQAFNVSIITFIQKKIRGKAKLLTVLVYVFTV